MLHELFAHKDPVLFAIPFFFVSIAVELAALKWLDHDDNLTGYMFKDARTSISMGLGSLVSTTLLKLLALIVYGAIYVVMPWHVPLNWWGILLVVLGLDFFYYWNHRFVHRTRVGWAAHQAHHSSEYMNFATALRQKWNPWFELAFYLPLAVLGFSPAAIFMASSISLVYQFFVHTEMIDRLWAPIELVFNTPSHHRVHHGSDEIYLDRNYGGILIIWDRLFGTFQAELQRPTYGLTYKVDTFNLIKLEYGSYAALFRDVRNAKSWRLKVNYLLRPPGWAPTDAQPTEQPETAGTAA
ncbi:MAG: sterol desaturase family protein [Nocardioides sp.]|nr:sterol desaturase family protein [Nocardioides sp.]